MKLIFISFFFLFTSFLAKSQGYIFSYNQLDTTSNLIVIAEDSRQKVNVTDAKDIETNAVITITNVDASSANKIKVTYIDSAGVTHEINSESINSDTLVFLLASHIELAKGNYQILIDDVKKADIQFVITMNTPPVTKTNNEPSVSTYLSALANANFVGDNKFLANLTPIVTFGSIVNIGEKFSLDINPYLASDIDTKDSASFIPAMMLYGKAGFIFNSYFTVFNGKLKVTLMPAGFGLKILPNLKDSGINLFQHNLRIGAAISYSEVFQIGIQYTHGWHNLTTVSKNFYKDLFGSFATDIDYLTITGQFLIKGKADSDPEKKSNILFMEWRGCLSKKRLSSFTNTEIFTIGFRKDFSLTTIFSASTASKVRNNRLFFR